MFHTFLQRISEPPWVYDLIQSLSRSQESRRRLSPYLRATGQKTVLDVGAGTGLYVDLLPDTARYLGLDLDLQRLRKLSRRRASLQAVVGDATQLCLADQSVDVGVCIAVSHHLTEQQLSLLFEELARVVKEQVVFLDAVADTGIRGRLLWKYDRGNYPHSTGTLLGEFGRHFQIEQVERYAIHHHYLLCIGRPKPNVAGQEVMS